MPYSLLTELPSAVKKLPKHAQEIFMSAFNSAFAAFDPKKHRAKTAEAYAFSVAWSAVKKAGYKKEGNPMITKFSINQVSECRAYEEDGEKYIEIPITGVRKDRDGDDMGTKAGESIIKKLKSKMIPMFGNHGLDAASGKKNVYKWQDILGGWEGGRWAKNEIDVIAKSRLNKSNPESELLYNYVGNKMPVGFSIGGKAVIGTANSAALKAFEMESFNINKSHFDDFDLYEVSPVGIPAYPYAVNKSFSIQLSEHFEKIKEVDHVDTKEKKDKETDEFKKVFGKTKDEFTEEEKQAFVKEFGLGKMEKEKKEEEKKEEEKKEAEKEKKTEKKIAGEMNYKVFKTKEEFEETLGEAVEKALTEHKLDKKSLAEKEANLQKAEKAKKELENKSVGELAVGFMRV